MYDTFYGLTQAPFRLSPDIHFCYQFKTYARAKAYMRYALDRGEGFAVVMGRPGTGKTTLILDLLRDLSSQRRLAAQMDSGQLDADDLLRLVTHALGLPVTAVDKASLIHDLREHLSALTEGEGAAVLIIDEAQNLTGEVLEELRLITNLQKGPKPLVQVVLVGRESLGNLIDDPRQEKVHQRVVAACHLEAMDLIETRAYITHRLLIAGWNGHPAWDAEALKTAFLASRGVPRLVNAFCDRLLLHGSQAQRDRITADDAKAALKAYEEETLAPPTDQSLWADLPEIDDLGPEVPEDSRALAGDQIAIDRRAGDETNGAPSPNVRLALANRGTPFQTADHWSGAQPTPVDADKPEPALDARGGPRVGAGVEPNEGQPNRDPGPTPTIPGTGEREPAPRSVAASAPEQVNVGVEPASVATLRTKRRASPLPYSLVAGTLLAIAGAAYVMQRGGLEAVIQGGEPMAEQDPGGTVDVPSQTTRPDGPPSSPAVTASASPDAPDPEQVAAEDLPGPAATQGTAMALDAGPALVVEPDNSEQSSPREGREASPEIIAAPSRIDTGPPALDLPEERQADGSSEPEPGEAVQDRPRLAGLAAQRLASEETGLAFPDATLAFPQTASDVAEPEVAATVPLLDELDRLGYQVTKLDGGKLALNMQEEIPFAVDSANLPANAQPVLTELAEVLARDDRTRVTIVAHTDARGPTEYNRRLSLERAQAVERYLRSRGVSQDNLASLGMGEDVPLQGDGDSPAVHERRIELILEPR